MEYQEHLNNQFKNLEINIVKHDTSSTGLPCYIECKLGKTPKDKGLLVLDLGNYIARMGFRYQMTPEFHGKGKKTTIRWFMSWDDIQPIRKNILYAFGKEKLLNTYEYLPFEFQSLIIQNTSRGVFPKTE